MHVATHSKATGNVAQHTCRSFRLEYLAQGNLGRDGVGQVDDQKMLVATDTLINRLQCLLTAIDQHNRAALRQKGLRNNTAQCTRSPGDHY
ncbi:hypothetical protein D3C85_1612150 [compost metagenome]